MSISRRKAGLVSILSILSLFLSPQSVLAQTTDPMNAKCADLEVVYARGSGQSLGDGEFGQLKKKLDAASKATGRTYHLYELGTKKFGGSQYRAIPVDGDVGKKTNAVLGKLSGGEAFEYGKSVDEGVSEAADYISKRSNKCLGTSKFFLAGYSQGAHVIGDAYSYKLSDLTRSEVIFNGLFGDPKLYLPEGEGQLYFTGTTYSKYARGDRSEWRRDVPDPSTYKGSLGARRPYLPEGWTAKTGLWCNDNDYVCGSDKSFNFDGHGEYKVEHGAIDQAVEEAFKRLAKEKGADPAVTEGQLRAVFMPPKAGLTGLDVVFLVDSTGSMQEDIDDAKVFASQFASTIENVKGRVALVEYRDEGDEFTARILSNLNGDVSEFRAKLDTISADGGGDEPEAALHALMTAFNGLNWRAGATKAAVVLTDASYHDPDMVDGSTLAQVVKRSMEIDPVNVYPVVPSYSAEVYAELADRTSGQVIVSDGDAATALETALTKVVSRPVVQLPLNAYYTLSTQETVFDASNSYSVDSEIVRWDWDFDGDGVFEIENGEPVVKHTYPASGDFNVNVRATDQNGQIGSHSVSVHVDTTTGLPVLPKPATQVSVSAVEGNAKLKWEAAELPTDGWLIQVNGIIVGRVEPEGREVTITDFPLNADTEYGVMPVNSDGLTGESVVARLGQPTTSQPQPPADGGRGSSGSSVFGSSSLSH